MDSDYCLCSMFVPGERHVIVGTKVSFLNYCYTGINDVERDTMVFSNSTCREILSKTTLLNNLKTLKRL